GRPREASDDRGRAPGSAVERCQPREGTVGTYPPDIQVHTPRLLRAWQVTAFAVAVAATLGVATGFVYSPRVAASDAQDVLGYVLQVTHFKSLPAHRIARFEAHSPLPSPGVEAGGLMVVAPPRGTLLPGESVRLQIHHGGGGFRTIDVRSSQIGRLSNLVDNVDFAASVNAVHGESVLCQVDSKRRNCVHGASPF